METLEAVCDDPRLQVRGVCPNDLTVCLFCGLETLCVLDIVTWWLCLFGGYLVAMKQGGAGGIVFANSLAFFTPQC